VKTETLIEALSRDLQPTRPRVHWRRFAATGAAGLLIAFAVGVPAYGIRPDLAEAINAALLKNAFSLLFAAALAPLAFMLAQPNIRVRRLAWPALGLAALSLSTAALSLAATAPSARMTAWLADGVPVCLERIPLMAAPIGVLLLLAARKLAPTRLTLAGGAVGGLAGAIAAIAYSWFCQVDSTPYVATWYLASIALCAGVGAVFGRWLLRW
jgi:hypothetical protein